jgi:putative ABC transport system permease protein
VGVVRNFHFQSMHEEIGPAIFGWNAPWTWNASVRVATNNIQETIQSIQDTWHELMPGFPFEYHFLDEYFDRQYKEDERFGRMINDVTLLGVFIACLGLLGLVSFITTQRTKEVGIRKVLGASSASIGFLLCNTFGRLVILANLIACPIAFFLMKKWLTGFAYRIGMAPWMFLIPGIATLLVAFATVCYHTVKAARANPVESLRYE